MQAEGNAGHHHPGGRPPYPVEAGGWDIVHRPTNFCLVPVGVNIVVGDDVEAILGLCLLITEPVAHGYHGTAGR